jgi:diguanylate cyclase (GGDEF)-like protein/PAS domain S-box-containing protein
MRKRAKRPGRIAVGGAKDATSFAIRLVEHLVVPTFVIGSDGCVLIWNKACERLTGIAASEVAGTREHWRAFYAQERPCLADLVLRRREAEAVSLYAAHSDVVSTSNGLSAENWCVMPKGAKRLYLAIDAGPIYNDAGEIVAVVESLRDITAQKQAEAELQVLASSDGLTAIGNRRFFDQRLSDEWRRALRRDSRMSMLMVDVDFFKQYNDAFGHQRGDECLRLVAATIVSQLFRAGDVAARYGGEEFAVILPDTDAIGAFEVAERIRAAIEALALPHPAPRGIGFVTASIGVACVEASSSQHVEKLVCFADIALYRAKETGRNCVAAYEEASGCRNARVSQHAGSQIPIISSSNCAACRLTAETSSNERQSDQIRAVNISAA